MRTLPSGLAAALLLALPACALLTAPQPYDGDFTFHIRELHGLSFSEVGDPKIGLFIETEQEFSCLLPLDVSVSTSPGHIDANVRGIGRTELCLTAVGPASFQSMIALAEGEHSLRITAGSRSDEYTIRVTDEAIEIEAVTAGFTRPNHTRSWRYPRDSFAYVCDAWDGHEAACAAFAETLETEVGVRPFSFGADGEIPYPTAWAAYGRDWRVTYYEYDAPEDFARAGELMHAHRAEHPSLTFLIVNWRNEAYRSWTGGE